MFSFNCRYFSKEKYSNLLERVPIAFIIISGVLLTLDLIGIMLMFERKDNQPALSDDDQSAYIIQNSDNLDSEIEISVTDKYKII